MAHEKNRFLFLVLDTKKVAAPCCRLMETELRKSLHIIIGTVEFTKLQWLPVLGNIKSPYTDGRTLYCEFRTKYKVIQYYYSTITELLCQYSSPAVYPLRG